MQGNQGPAAAGAGEGLLLQRRGGRGDEGGVLRHKAALTLHSVPSAQKRSPRPGGEDTHRPSVPFPTCAGLATPSPPRSPGQPCTTTSRRPVGGRPCATSLSLRRNRVSLNLPSLAFCGRDRHGRQAASPRGQGQPSRRGREEPGSRSCRHHTPSQRAETQVGLSRPVGAAAQQPDWKPRDTGRVVVPHPRGHRVWAEAAWVGWAGHTVDRGRPAISGQWAEGGPSSWPELRMEGWP